VTVALIGCIGRDTVPTLMLVQRYSPNRLRLVESRRLDTVPTVDWGNMEVMREVESRLANALKEYNLVARCKGKQDLQCCRERYSPSHGTDSGWVARTSITVTNECAENTTFLNRTEKR